MLRIKKLQQSETSSLDSFIHCHWKPINYVLLKLIMFMSCACLVISKPWLWTCLEIKEQVSRTFLSKLTSLLNFCGDFGLHIITKECVKSVSGMEANETFYLLSQFRLFRRQWRSVFRNAIYSRTSKRQTKTDPCKNKSVSGNLIGTDWFQNLSHTLPCNDSNNSYRGFYSAGTPTIDRFSQAYKRSTRLQEFTIKEILGSEAPKMINYNVLPPFPLE